MTRAATGRQHHPQPRRPSATESDPRWAALCARDSLAAGTFFYAVRTTGVYCRPSCAARRPRPENVVFHATIEAAEAAGFRPCKRCKPEQLDPRSRQAASVARLCRFIETSETTPQLEQLAQHAGLSPSHTHRIFKAVTGVTPGAYARSHRAKRLRDGLRAAPTVTDAIYAAGYGSSGRFYEESNAVLGMTPRQYRASGQQSRIRFAVGQCSLGSILVAASDRGVCAISLGDDPETLTQDLARRFPKADLIGADAAFERLVARVVGLVEKPRVTSKLPLDIHGSLFQQRVWQALTRIPPGTTLTYSELAQAIGAPSATRAVASACAANTLAVAIPCHRVVRRDGSLSGYRWGIERKRELLERESDGPAQRSESELRR